MQTNVLAKVVDTTCIYSTVQALSLLLVVQCVTALYMTIVAYAESFRGGGKFSSQSYDVTNHL